MSFPNSLIFPESFSIDLRPLPLVVGQGKHSSREVTGKRMSGGRGTGGGSQPNTCFGVGLTAESSVTLGYLLSLSASQFLLKENHILKPAIERWF